MVNVLIVGLGLLGGSYAKGLCQKGYDVYGIDPNEESLKQALEEKVIKKGSINPDKTLISMADIVVFGVYPKLMLGWVAEYQEYFKSGAVITDVLGVKKQIVVGMEKILRDDVHYVGGHPMAGKEVSGYGYADEKIFKKANFILTPTENTNLEALEKIEAMAKDLEFKEISVLSPEEHDKVIGFLSQLTHVIAVSLMNSRDNEKFVKYTGDSFRDLTRIAMINEHLWSELFLENKDVLLEEINVFIDEMMAFRDILQDEDVESMKEKFRTSTERRKLFL